MKKTKLLKLISVLLCLVLAISVIPAFADEADTGNNALAGSTITANDFTWYLDDGDLDASSIRLMSSASAKDADGAIIASKNIKISAEQVDAINNSTENTVFDILLTVPDGTTKTIKATIYAARPFPRITAKSFSYDLSNGDLTAEKVLELSEAVSYNYAGTALPASDLVISAADLRRVNNKSNLGENSVGLISDNTSKMKLITVTTTYGNNTDVKVTISGSDFSYVKDTENPLTSAKALELASVSAKNQFDEAVDLRYISVDTAQLKAINAASQTGTYPLTFISTNSDSSLSVNVEVTVPVKLTLVGSDFKYDYNKDLPLTAQLAKQLSGIVAKDQDGKVVDTYDITVSEDDLAKINSGEAGKYDLNFTLTTGASLTLSVTVTIPKITIKATDFTFTYDAASKDPLTAAMARELSFLSATDQDNKTINLQDIAVDEDQLKTINEGKEGTFPLTFTASNDKATASATVNVKVEVKNAIPSLTISAKDFAFPQIKGKENKLTAEKAIQAAEAKLLDTDGKEYEGLSVDEDGLNAINAATEDGTFDLTFSCIDDDSVPAVTVKVSVVFTEDPVNPSARLTATDFTFTKVKGSDSVLTAEDAINRANVKAFDAEDKEYAVTVIANEELLKAINSATESGVFDLSFTNKDDETMSTTIKVTLKLTDGDDPKYEVNATDFTYDRSTDGASLTADKAKELAKLSVTDIETGEPEAISQVTVDATQLAAINAGKDGDKLPLKFSIDVKSYKEITVTIRDKSIDPPVDKESIDASPFTYNTANGKLTETEAKRLANVKATDENGKAIEIDQIMVDPNEFSAIANASTGTYDLTFSAGVKSSITIKVTLTNEAEGTSTIRAYNFTYDLANGNLTATRAKAYASVSAKNGDNKKIALSKITVDGNQLSAINTAKAGDKKDLTFKTPDGTSKTIVVTVKDTSKTANNWLAMIIQFLNNMFGGNIFG